MYKVTEVNNLDSTGVLEITDIELTGGTFLSLSEKPLEICPKKYNFLTFGDSVSVGYGIDKRHPCDFTAETEDSSHAFPFLIANQLSADLHLIAWSGKGVVRNYGDSQQTSLYPLPSYYNHTFGSYTQVLISMIRIIGIRLVSPLISS
jgi:hypothetical protein